jgi:hypothetical protein
MNDAPITKASIIQTLEWNDNERKFLFYVLAYRKRSKTSNSLKRSWMLSSSDQRKVIWSLWSQDFCDWERGLADMHWMNFIGAESFVWDDVAEISTLSESVRAEMLRIWIPELIILKYEWFNNHKQLQSIVFQSNSRVIRNQSFLFRFFHSFSFSSPRSALMSNNSQNCIRDAFCLINYLYQIHN